NGTRYDALQSWSYRIVSGAQGDSANPLKMAAAGTFTDGAGPLSGHGDILISGHTEYAFPYDGPPEYAYENGARAAGLASVAPTVIRTGTGSIDLAAGRNLQMTDTMAPGVIYTAGRVSAPINDAGFSAEVIPSDNTYSIGSILTPDDPTGFHQ